MASETNPYLALREAKIARNEARMLELGLLRTSTRSSSSASQRAVKRRKNAATVTPSQEDGGPPKVLRRSSRNRGEAPVSYQDVPTERTRQQQQRPISYAQQKDTAWSQVQVETELNVLPEAVPSSFPKNSARAMKLNVKTLVLGADNDSSSGFLGRSMDRTGKAFVMEESARTAVEDFAGGSISFNKYSGVQEWGSAALFLWVNLEAPKADVVNDFLDDGRQVTWFGGSRMHDGTPAIQRLIRAGKQQAAASKESSSSAKNGIVLWCRRYLVDKRTFGPYVCLGRLSYQSHIPGSQPLAFVWNMLDYDLLSNHEDEAVRETFRDMVS